MRLSRLAFLVPGVLCGSLLACKIACTPDIYTQTDRVLRDLWRTAAVHDCPAAKPDVYSCNVFIGFGAGSEFTVGSNNFLVGEGVQTPTPTTSDFVNLDNLFCFYRDQHQKVPCPPRHFLQEEQRTPLRGDQREAAAR